MITYAEVFDRAMEDNDYSAVMTIETACERDLNATYEEYSQSIAECEKANKCEYEFDKAYLEMQRAYVAYLEKRMLYSRFRGYYKI